MVSRHRQAFPLFVLVLALCLLVTACSNAQSYYDKGKYAEAIRLIDKKGNPSSEDLILKAKSYIALSQDDKAIESLFLFLSLDDGSNPDYRAYAVEQFLRLNSSDRLAMLVLMPSDGVEAQKQLYLSYSRNANLDKADEMLQLLSESLGFYDYVSLMMDAPHDISYMLDIFSAWYGSINESDKPRFLELLSRFSSEVSIPENEAKRFLSLTDLLMDDSYFTEDDIRLSCLLKIKGNILDMLFDRVNARIYWTQALRLNPNDSQLRERMQQ